MSKRKTRAKTRRRPWKQLAELCGVMTHDVRESILIELAVAPRSAHWLANQQAMPIATLRRHLRSLIAKDLVVAVATEEPSVYRLGDSAQVLKSKSGVQLDLSTADGGRLIIERRRPMNRR